MKKLIILSVFAMCLSFTNYIEPPMNFNGVYYGQQGARVVNLGWNSNYPNRTHIIKRNGVIIASGYFEQYNRISIPVEANFKSARFSMSQTVNGETSSEVYTIVTK